MGFKFREVSFFKRFPTGGDVAGGGAKFLLVNGHPLVKATALWCRFKEEIVSPVVGWIEWSANKVVAATVDDFSVKPMENDVGMVAQIFQESGLGSKLEFSVLPPLKEDAGERDDSAEEFAGELDARVGAGHGLAVHGERLIAVEIFPKTGAGEIHFEQAGDDGEDEIPEGEALLDEIEESKSDDGVKKKPERGVKGGVVKRRAGVDLWIDVVSLKPGENEKESGQNDVDGSEEDFHDR